MAPAITTESLIAMLALIGAVILVSALLSGFIERSNFPQVAVFLGLGAALGTSGLGMLDIGLDSGVLRVVATLSLALVLFTDALTLDLSEVRRHGVLASLILGPGTILSAGIVTLAGCWFLGLPLAAAAILGAALASTDPVLLRGLLRRPDLPSSARQGLRLESGLNDVVLLPVVILGMAFLGQGGAPNLGRIALQVLVLGPVAGAVVAWVAIKLLELMRRHVGVRRDYESIYSLGVAFAAFAAAEAFHSSGFLAAFAAGLTIAALDVELCDCFREYGETTAEMLLMFAFVLLGGSLIWSGLGLLSVPLVLFALVAFAARPLSLLLALAPLRMDGRSRGIVAWFGPRGLSSLLLVLVPVFGGTPGAERLFAICSVVVLLSVAVHGGSIMAFGRFDRRRAAPTSPLTPGSGPPTAPDTLEILTPEEVRAREAAGESVWLVDVRSERDYLASDLELDGSIRLDPQQATRTATQQGIPKDAWVALFCT